jgi:hypothetical protein
MADWAAAVVLVASAAFFVQRSHLRHSLLWNHLCFRHPSLLRQLVWLTSRFLRFIDLVMHLED